MHARSRLVACAPLLLLSLAAGCGPQSGRSGPPAPNDLGEPPDGAPDLSATPDDLGEPGDLTGVLDVQPAGLQTLAVTVGQAPPSITFAATLGGQPANVAWTVDRGNLAAIEQGPQSSSTLTPKGSAGGLVSVIASLNGQSVTRQVLIQLSASQNGADAANPDEAKQLATSAGQLTAGGGVGGVGGEGLGGALTDAPTTTALSAPGSDGSAQHLTLLYPYDQTVFPRGLLAPLLQWRWDTDDADAIQLELQTTSGSFHWKGTFARPAILGTGQFRRHPIPQDVWKMATDSAGGPTPSGAADRLLVRLTIAKGGQAYGPLTQTWTIAPGRLSGIIYYNSYGTQLAKNSNGGLVGNAVGGDHQFGGAVLSIHVGDTGPKLVAGADGDHYQCRVCHSVAANGSRLVVHRYGSGIDHAFAPASAYDLPATAGSEHQLSYHDSEGFVALTPDGNTMLTAEGKLYALPDDTTALPVSGLSGRLGSPAFDPTGTLMAYNPLTVSGSGSATTYTSAQTLVLMSFDPTKGAFSKAVTVVDDTKQMAGVVPGWPAFFPDSRAIVFHHQSVGPSGGEGGGGGVLSTLKGARAQLAWTSVSDSSHVHGLDQLNGKNGSGNVYLPQLPTAVTLGCTNDGVAVGTIDTKHEDDVDLNYEPTVNPVASGGYAWVVFTSRRMYGNVATIPPFCSDPRGVDLVQNITTKKLWVAAIDVNGAVGTDPSHPAFYLPGQELLAGNSRGFWVTDPCLQDGEGCETGDQCCNGFCEPNGAGGANVCSNTPPNQTCSHEQEKCATAQDCCDARDLCINGFCSIPPIGRPVGPAAQR